jgi:hypothetical protein
MGYGQSHLRNTPPIALGAHPRVERAAYASKRYLAVAAGVRHRPGETFLGPRGAPHTTHTQQLGERHLRHVHT